MAGNSAPVRVNRAPVLTLWAAVVAERLGHPPDTALSLASIVAGTAARAKARRLGIAEEEHDHGKAPPPAKRETVRFLGRDIPITHDEDGVVLADAGDGRPAPAAPPRAYVAKAFGTRLEEVRAAMRDLALSLEPDELNRVGFHLYERFRPEVPADASGWGAKGLLDLERIRSAASH
ncbi:hypothetical protein [Muricoccus pecuniae]|uniref:Uncharacterized protein n=1 Tax=Muricoccus pecuniae TaxID=693023 RepID=A0A840YCM4_9PROT|nr:hypothetical protein [Roseomonas pecuniae]MBB5694107.1 hypothetical protein [Roseomonas pecuniae]